MKRAIAIVTLLVCSPAFAQKALTPTPMPATAIAVPIEQSQRDFRAMPGNFRLILDENGRPALERRHRPGVAKLWVTGLSLLIAQPVVTMIAASVANRQGAQIGLSAIPVMGPLLSLTLEDQPSARIGGWIAASLIGGAGLAAMIVGLRKGPLMIERFPVQVGAGPMPGGAALSVVGKF